MSRKPNPIKMFLMILAGAIFLSGERVLADDEEQRSYRFKQADRAFQFSTLESIFEEKFEILKDVSITSIGRTYMDYLEYIPFTSRRFHWYSIDFEATVRGQNEIFFCELLIEGKNVVEAQQKFRRDIYINDCESEHFRLHNFFLPSEKLGIQFSAGRKELL